MAEESLSKISSAREYVPSMEVKIDGGVMGVEVVSVPLDKNAAISQNHITAAMAQKAWDSVAIKMVNRKDVTPKEIKDMVDAAKGIVEIRALAYSADRPADLPMLNSTAAAIGQGMGKALTDAIAAGASKETLVDKLAKARQAGESKIIDA